MLGKLYASAAAGGRSLTAREQKEKKKENKIHCVRIVRLLVMRRRRLSGRPNAESKQGEIKEGFGKSHHKSYRIAQGLSQSTSHFSC